MNVGDRVKFAEDRRWWTVRAKDDRYTILTRQAPFRPAGEVIYTIVDAVRGVRGPCNLIGQGWDMRMGDAACAELLDALNGRWELNPHVAVSHRNNLPVAVTAHQSAGWLTRRRRQCTHTWPTIGARVLVGAPPDGMDVQFECGRCGRSAMLVVDDDGHVTNVLPGVVLYRPPSSGT